MRRVLCVIVAVLLMAGSFAGCSVNEAEPVSDNGTQPTATNTDIGESAEATYTDIQSSMNKMLGKYLPDLDLQYGMGRDQIAQLGLEIVDGGFNVIEDGSCATIEKTKFGLTGETGEAKLFYSDSCGLFGLSYDVTGEGLENLTAEFGEPVAVTLADGIYYDWLVDGVFLSISSMEDAANFTVMAGEQAKAEYPNEWKKLTKEPASGGEQGQGADWGYGEDYNLASGGNFVVQGNWLYYFKKEIPGIYKMPVGGAADQVQLLGEPLLNYKMYVVGDWIYFACEGYLYRLSTDGTVQEDVMSTDTWTNEVDYYIAGNDLFYTTSEKISASERTCSIIKCDLTSGESGVIYEGASVLKGYQDTLFIDFPDEHIAQIDFDGNVIQEEVPGVGLEYDPASDTFIWDGKLVYADGTQSDTTYFTDMESLFIDISSATVYFCPETYQSNLFLIGRGLDDLITQNEPGFYSCDLSFGNITKINNDTPTHIWEWGDGYVYYSVKSSVGYPCYRCKPDGSEWEEIDWMYLQ